MSAPAAEMARLLMNHADANIGTLATGGSGYLSGDQVAAIAQVQATCAVASALLAIAEQLGQTVAAAPPANSSG